MIHQSEITSRQFVTQLAWIVLACAVLFSAHALADEGRDQLFDALKNASTEEEARAIEDQIWESWMADAPDMHIRLKIETAMQRRHVYDLEGAETILDEVVEAAPDYSEGWNQRAFIYFLQGNYEASLADIKKTLALEPRHFGALSGKAMIYMTQGRTKLGQEILKEAVEIHPFLKERGMLLPENRPAKSVDL
ncbi:tetratricopeptide repeat protein [Labrenzia sp. PHM005]|uniref:tetratricopeptide repeat protein n=1 Tax=Labrenzia sp. PHM005 TaxID=2590016 RepID=UPI0011407134|nr:tetratricopeptide repeat protein [Labrenzia sp. PHM005]QDG76655.1 tetratricopeptide repeat protein [Labrenzia sp. PHM005]